MYDKTEKKRIYAEQWPLGPSIKKIHFHLTNFLNNRCFEINL